MTEDKKGNFFGAKNFPTDGMTGTYGGAKLIPKKSGYEKESVAHTIGDDLIWGTAVLNSLLEAVPSGTEVTVKYGGTEKTDKGYKHLWLVDKKGD